MSGIIKCPKCGKNLLVSKTVIEEGEHIGTHHVSCLSCGYETYVPEPSYKPKNESVSSAQEEKEINWFDIVGNDLMIGDVVSIKLFKKKAKVLEVYEKSVKTDVMYPVLLSDIEPVRITREELVSAGFTSDEMYANYDVDENRYLEYYYHEKRLRMYAKGSHNIIFAAQCTYLHELQHALKLCYINNLFA